MFYMLASIDDGGFMYEEPRYCMIHQESVFELVPGTHFRGFDAAKAARKFDEFIAKVDESGHVCELWVMPEHHDRVSKRLRIWSGCYGSWPVRQLSEEP